MQNLRTGIHNKPFSHFGAFSNKCTKSKKTHLKSDTITYLFAFNGKEKIDEINGAGNDLDFGARIYDARVGRWMSVDPVVYACQSGYVCFNNSPIFFFDYYGLEGEPGDRTTGPTENKSDKNSGLSYLGSQNKGKQKDGPSWLKSLVDFVTGRHNGPSGKWVKDNPKNWTQLPGTFNSDNNTYGYSSSANCGDRIISYKIEIDYPNYLRNLSYFKLNGIIPGSHQQTKTLRTGGAIPIWRPTGNYIGYSGLGGRITDIAAILLNLSTRNIISLNPLIVASIMMTGQIVGKRMNPVFRDYSDFQISIISNQQMSDGDIRMFVRYKRYVPYLDLAKQEKGFLKRWYYGF
jgi:RHS repeat-associated protein